MRTRTLITSLTALFVVTSLHAADQRPDEHSLKLNADAVGLLTIRMDAKSEKIAQATLSCYQNVSAILIHLKLPADAKVHELAKKLDQQLVQVTGTFEIWVDPPMGRMPLPAQYSLRVETLKAVKKAK